MPSPTPGRDKLRLTSADELLDALGGDDTVFAGDGQDTIYGGAGRDRLYGEGGDDVLWGGDGDNTLEGGAGVDNLFGGEADDLIRGGDGRDYIYGFGGDNRLYGDGGDDFIEGGEARDTIHGGDGMDFLAGNGGKDRLYGDAGDDTMDGSFGDDALYGGDGIDRLRGGAGKDTLDGGAGVDYAFYGGVSTDYRITTAANGVTTVQDLRGDDGTDRLTGVERLFFEDRTVTLSAPDPDATFATAQVISAGEWADGQFSASASLDLPDDVDVWRVELQAGVTVTAITAGASPRTDVAVYDAAGQFLAVNHDDSQDDPDGPIPPAPLVFTPGTTGTYYFAVSGYAHVPTGAEDPVAPAFTGFSGQSGDYVFSLGA